MIQRHEVNKCCWEDGTVRFAQHRVATNLRFKNAISTKHNKMRYAYNMISTIDSETYLFTEIILNLFLTGG